MKRLWIFGILAVVWAACTDDDFKEIDGGIPIDASFIDGGVICSDPAGDEDNDGIANGDEGCLSGRDSDGDKIPDWQDYDSDDDGITDNVEKGQRDANGMCKHDPESKWPCDSDGDGVADYVDLDSDSDGLMDADEDHNGDGLLGCCLIACNKPGEDAQQDECILTSDGCGPGQTCESNHCMPALSFECSNGETNPRVKDTFGDGKLDNERGTFVCRDATEDKPQGRKSVMLKKSQEGDWHIALEMSASHNDLKISNATEEDKMAAAVIDESDIKTEVAGFVVSRATQKDNVQDELTEIIQALTTKPPGGPGTVSVRASGIQVKSHDHYDSIQGTILDLTLTTGSNISTVRNELIGTIMGKPMADLGNLPGPYGTPQTEIVVRFVTLKRVELEDDGSGNKVDSGDKSKWRLLVMGAVVGKQNYQDASRRTGFIVDDLSSGTALATSADTVNNECDVGMITSLPVADIIWVVDESGSMEDNRQDIVNNANNFFSRALASGLDFRMCVTNVVQPEGDHAAAVGKCCSKISTDDNDDGGTDRFLLPAEQSIFSACINNPPGYEGYAEYGLVNAKEAVKRHLPRELNTPDRIRSAAKLVIIIATDEIPESLYDPIGYDNLSTCTLDTSAQSAVNTAVQPYLDLFTGVSDAEGAAMFHVIGGVCNNSCTADVAHGYKELAQQLGGQIGDVCQKDLGNTLQVIIDSIVGEASPVSLEYVPISSSLAVAMDGVELARSRTNGFDYRSATNTLVFINVSYQKGSEIIASYKRWEKQAIPD